MIDARYKIWIRQALLNPGVLACLARCRVSWKLRVGLYEVVTVWLFGITWMSLQVNGTFVIGVKGALHL